MRVLADVEPTAQQLTIIRGYEPGFVVIRGAAGSGKTTTAVLRLSHITNVWRRQRRREEDDAPLRVTVLTYNKTLRGYVEQLIEQMLSTVQVDLTLATFGRWANQALGNPDKVDGKQAREQVKQLGSPLRLDPDFLWDEVEYVLGRFPPSALGDYADPGVTATYDRTGRGKAPRVDRTLRRRLVDEVVLPYQAWKKREGVMDWSDMAVEMANGEPTEGIEIAIVDEAQDFSANQVRALSAHLAETHSTTFVLDAMQRIYPRGFTWQEAGITVRPANSHRLERNFRNTKEVAAFAFPLVKGLELDDDGTLPEFENTERSGPRPVVVGGLFRAQTDWLTEWIGGLEPGESVGLLHPKGGGWFDYLRGKLDEAGLPYVEITRRSEWPQGDEEIALSTLNSAKGLEFDHVAIVGLNAEMLPHGPEENDSQLNNHRRLVAMGIGRARKSVVITYKPGEESRVVGLLDPQTFDQVDL